ncbi:MAG: hypothetical protein R3C44_04700 [Chloroflexota bacterium]
MGKTSGRGCWKGTSASYGRKTEPEWPVGTDCVLAHDPNYYLQYFYAIDHKLAEQEAWPPSRAEQVMKIEDGAICPHAEPDRNEPPPGLMQRRGLLFNGRYTTAQCPLQRSEGTAHR